MVSVNQYSRTLGYIVGGGGEAHILHRAGPKSRAKSVSATSRAQVTHPKFEWGCAVLILLCAVLIGVEAHWSVENIGLPEPLVFRVLNSIFNITFAVELILRATVDGLHFLSCTNPSIHWNLMDAILVASSSPANSHAGCFRCPSRRSWASEVRKFGFGAAPDILSPRPWAFNGSSSTEVGSWRKSWSCCCMQPTSTCQASSLLHCCMLFGCRVPSFLGWSSAS